MHAIRNLARIGFGTVAVRWSQLGFGRTSTTSTSQSTPRNLFGFKDGTANIKAEETEDVEKHVWVAAGDDAKADWLAGGSYLVARRINMTIEIWDRQPLGDQEDFVGRTKDTGAPLSGGTEFTEPDFAMPGSNGAGHRRGRARPARAPRLQRRRPDAAPRLQLRRRLQPARRPGRRAVLHRLRARPGHPLHPDPEQDGQVATR